MAEPERARQERLAARAAKYATSVAHLRSLTADDLCSHGVAPTSCTEHRPTKTTTEESQP